ncbi:MAG: DNA mismatch repair protein MutS [Erysipelothrix sp.]|nr:DNA mismatch repair protein MutS [Erysipelothrix sp.]
MSNVSPMLQQYLSMKQEVPGALLLFRLGDFYEAFFEDARIVSNELDLVLTERAAGNNQKAPMCGVPHHAVSSYIQRLVTKGHKVAMAEQMEDPAEAKGLVHREIVKIITPGLNIDQDEKQVNQIVSIESDLTDYHLVFFNLSLNHSSTLSIEKDFSLLTLTLLQNHVVEVILDDQELMSELSKSSYFLLSTHRVKSKGSPQSIAEERLLSYLEFTQKQRVEPKPQNNQQAIMAVDYSSALNLELTESIRHSSKKNTLWGFLDKTCTTMGSRRLREWILKPLYSSEKIMLRQDKIAYLIDHFLIAHQMSEQLTKIADIYKINTKISYQSASAQELVRLKQSLLAIQDLKELLKESPLDEMSELPDMADIIDLLSKTLQDEVPVYLKDGQTIREGVNQELDELRALLADSNSWLLEYENQQKQLTGIKNLKVGYSRTFGYYIEVSKSQVHLVDESLGYKRRQTLTSGQRYISLDLKAQEDKITTAKDRILAIENQCFEELLKQCLDYTTLLDDIATRVSDTDVLYALSIISGQSGYVRPTFTTSKAINIIDSYHPILETTLKQHDIIANDVKLSETEDVMILTGPNMGGKSTYMRQVALIVIMAQMGCYVRAKQATLPLFDAIYTRMGASDDILMGQSTFMIEMSEANYALSRATKHSLILFDEIGRGTSTYDGMAIAKAIIEYIATKIKATCIFSTHYHEITDLEEVYDNVINCQVGVLEEKDKITFLYHVVPGKADKSYGIHVAKLAELPYSLIQAANKNLRELQKNNSSQSTIVYEQSPLEDELVDVLTKLDINKMSPLESQAVLIQLVEMIGEKD